MTTSPIPGVSFEVHNVRTDDLAVSNEPIQLPYAPLVGDTVWLFGLNHDLTITQRTWHSDGGLHIRFEVDLPEQEFENVADMNGLVVLD